MGQGKAEPTFRARKSGNITLILHDTATLQVANGLLLNNYLHKSGVNYNMERAIFGWITDCFIRRVEIKDGFININSSTLEVAINNNSPTQKTRH